MTKTVSSTYKLLMGLLALCAIFFIGIQVSKVEASQKPVQMIVTFDEEVYASSQAQEALLSRFGGQVELPLPFMNAVAVSLPGAGAANALSHVSGVTGVYEDMEMSLVKKPSGTPGGGGGDTPTQPPEKVDWGVDTIDADQVWGTETGAGVVVAVLDTGIDADHPDLIDNVIGGKGYIRRESWSNDGQGHGTHVAGTVAAIDNEIGYVGVAPQASLYGVQVLDRNGSGRLSYLLSGINWAINNGADVITMSLSFGSTVTIDQLPGLAGALDAAEAAGVVVVAAAGNNGSSVVPYPAKYPSVIAVAATADASDNIASYSNWGAEVDVAAPGSSISSTWKNGGYNTISGTSMATPHVAGVAALILGQGVTDSNTNGRVNDEVFNEIVAAGTHTVNGSKAPYGFGRVDVVEALGL